MFKQLSIILNILFNKFNFFNLKSLTLKICGKIDGKMRKKKLFFSIGKNNFSRFDSKYSFLFLSKLTVFGSLGFKFYIIYD